MRKLLAVLLLADLAVLVTYPLWAWFLATVVLGGWLFAAALCRVASVCEMISRDEWDRQNEGR